MAPFHFLSFFRSSSSNSKLPPSLESLPSFIFSFVSLLLPPPAPSALSLRLPPPPPADTMQLSIPPPPSPLAASSLQDGYASDGRGNTGRHLHLLKSNVFVYGGLATILRFCNKGKIKDTSGYGLAM